MSVVQKAMSFKLQIEGEKDYNNSINQIKSSTDGLKSELVKLKAEFA